MSTPWFASHGAEKMLYDWRMQPQAILYKDRLYVVYQAGTDGKDGQPYIVWMDTKTEVWSEPLRLGTVDGTDHHFAPILWIDRQGHLHIIYHCHRTPARHLISQNPDDPTTWKEGPHIADSMSYPTVWRVPSDRLVLVYRVMGHLGYWVCRSSEDGGYTWSEPRLLTDFDAEAVDETDRWAGSYIATLPGAGTTLHIGFVHWEERDNINPRYNTFKRDLFSRYNMYYMQADWQSGTLSTIAGSPLAAPVTRKRAENAKLFDSGCELTNFPSMTLDQNGYPLMVTPVSSGSPWNCRFTCFRWDGEQWLTSTICDTDNIWSSSLVWVDGPNTFKVWLIAGEGKGENCFYGGGRLELWSTQDAGGTWQREQQVTPVKNLIYNNPKQVFNEQGHAVPGWFVFFGWQGPESMWKTADPNPNRGYAFLYADGRIIGRP